MLFPTAEKFLSNARLLPYKQAMLGNEESALILYLDNLRVAQIFYTPLSILEIAFRNAMHDALSIHFGSDDWLLTQQTGFMIDQKLTQYDQRRGQNVTNDKVLRMVQAAINEFRIQRNYTPSNGPLLIAELSFGFWTTLFTKKYYLLLNTVPIRAFVKRPRGTTWETINNKLTDIRLFRNRVYHYEPLCFQKQAGSTLCFSQLSAIHADITDLLSWLDPSLAIWLAQADRVPETVKKMHKKYPKAS